jgi:hypothetical protein
LLLTEQTFWRPADQNAAGVKRVQQSTFYKNSGPGGATPLYAKLKSFKSVEGFRAKQSSPLEGNISEREMLQICRQDLSGRSRMPAPQSS